MACSSSLPSCSGSTGLIWCPALNRRLRVAPRPLTPSPRLRPPPLASAQTPAPSLPLDPTLATALTPLARIPLVTPSPSTPTRPSPPRLLLSPSPPSPPSPTARVPGTPSHPTSISRCQRWASCRSRTTSASPCTSPCGHRPKMGHTGQAGRYAGAVGARPSSRRPCACGHHALGDGRIARNRPPAAPTSAYLVQRAHRGVCLCVGNTGQLPLAAVGDSRRTRPCRPWLDQDGFYPSTLT